VLPHLAADQQFISRFVDEAQVAIKLQHVNVAQVFEVGRVADEYFLALEYIDGRDLRRTLAVLTQRTQRLPVDLALFIGRELANGLAYAHRRTGSDGASLNLVHCDISPPNVLVSFEGETKVIDFGIAKSVLRATETDPKMGFGKFGYMAPEQLIRGGAVDHRTDIYAAGVVLYELLAGHRLYEPGPEPDYRALAKAVAKGEHKLPSQLDKTLAPYDDLVATALRPKQEDRYQSAAEFRDAIQQALVGVNPTISTDQLGAFMRELFADEMGAQRELHERIARTHLEDFHEQLTTQTGTTVSFALAQLPIRATPTPSKGVPPPPTSSKPPSEPRSRRPTAPTDLLPQQPPLPPPVPTAAIPTNLIELADGTGAVPPSESAPASAPSARRSRAPLVIGVLVAIVAGAVVFAMTSDMLQSKPPAVASGEHVASASAQQVEVVPITEPDIDAAIAPSVIVDAAPAGPAASLPSPSTDTLAPSLAPTGSGSGSAKKPQKHHPEHPKLADKPEKVELTRDAVASNWQAVSAEYSAYKHKNGDRFEKDWNDLVNFQQYHGADLVELSRRIDALRAKLRE
jgi:serine/threonine protein kinase